MDVGAFGGLITPAHSLILRLVTLFIRGETPFALHKESRPRQLIFSLEKKKGVVFGCSCLLCLVSLNEFTCMSLLHQPLPLLQCLLCSYSALTLLPTVTFSAFTCTSDLLLYNYNYLQVHNAPYNAHCYHTVSVIVQCLMVNYRHVW